MHPVHWRRDGQQPKVAPESWNRGSSSHASASLFPLDVLLKLHLKWSFIVHIKPGQ
jgi:hypothetical protein